MKIYALFNIIIVDSIRINIVLLKYNALYFTYPPPPEKRDFSHIYRLVLLFIADSRKYHQILTLLNNNRWLDDNSTKFRRLLKQCNVFYLQFCLLGLLARISRHYKASRLLCSINAISSPSCVFKLQNPIAFHCLISPLKNWDVWVFFYGVNNPIEIHSCNSFYEL